MKKYLIKNITFIVPAIIFYGCSTTILEEPQIDYQYEIDNSKQYNTPFINSTETSKLDFGLSKEDVLNILGEPLFVAYGKGSTKTITWIYEVRKVLVESNIVQEEANLSFINGVDIVGIFESIEFIFSFAHSIAHCRSLTIWVITISWLIKT